MSNSNYSSITSIDVMILSLIDYYHEGLFRVDIKFLQRQSLRYLKTKTEEKSNVNNRAWYWDPLFQIRHFDISIKLSLPLALRKKNVAKIWPTLVLTDASLNRMRRLLDRKCQVFGDSNWGRWVAHIVIILNREPRGLRVMGVHAVRPETVVRPAKAVKLWPTTIRWITSGIYRYNYL